ncbi:hypothetical protein L1987_86548 [Smallanthus sonchifolius]|uniref:Uncharacterized protein n=1 Tax=Smallanthus sonchifolius TaxID=185202 RepID=A0ACB8XZM5_9ASTR|nr:hypothetical protein L1987_86548 [Smallanthus sonchifolius]
MLKPHVNHRHKSPAPPLLTRGNGGGGSSSGNPTSFLTHNTLAFPVKRHSRRHTGQIKAIARESSTAAGAVKTISLKAVITVQVTVGGFLSNILNLTKGLDDITDLLGKSLLMELVAADTDPKFEVPEDFGSIGAIKIENEHHKEVFVESVVIDGSPIGPITVACESWVHSKFSNPESRVFFVDRLEKYPS